MTKRILSLIAAVILLAAMLAAATVASAEGYYPVYSHCSNGKPLNVREGPGKEYAVKEKIPYGQVIYVFGETYPGWLQLNDGGFVQAALTSRTYPGPYVPPDPGKEPAKKESKDSLDAIYSSAKFVAPYMVTLKATSNSKGVANVRWAPSKAATLQKAYLPGTQVKVLAELNKWYQVMDPMTEMVGFVNSAYVEK